MYFYRLLTEPEENLGNYLEVGRFIQWRICPTDLPDFIFYMKPPELRVFAYEVIGQRLPA